MSNLVNITASDVAVGEKFFCAEECCEATVLATFSDSAGREHVMFESASGSVNRLLMDDFLEEYHRKLEHDLVKGDIFLFLDEDGRDVPSPLFLYVNDKNVVRFGQNRKYSDYGYLSFSDLKFYAAHHGHVNRIRKIVNIDSYGIEIQES